MDFLKKLTEIKELATLPTVAFRVLELVEDPNATALQITRVIETDAAITLKILRVANSPLYGFRTEITSVQQAVINLGLNRISNVLVGIALFTKFFKATAQQSIYMKEFWTHSTATGTVAKTLANKLRLNFHEREFIGGLMHDIGKIAMIQYFPNEYHETVQLIESEQIIDVEAERRVFGTDHNEAGEVIARMWKLPSDLSEIMTKHSNITLAENSQDVMAVVRIADLLCEMWGASVHEGITELELEREKAWDVLCKIRPSLRDMDVEVFTFELEEEFKKAELFISMMIG